MTSELLGALLVSRTTSSATPCDWEELARHAVRERVAAALSRALGNDDAIPADIRRRLKGELYNTGAFNLVLYRELSRVLNSRPSNAPVVLLKGGALATTVYEDIAHRPMCDLDLLVRRDDLDAWTECLSALGYAQLTPEMAHGLARRVHYQLAFRGGPDGDVVIELHWNLVAGDADWRAPDITWFWEQAETWAGLPDAGCPPALRLGPEANVLYLSAHAFLQHGGARTRLLWLYDIHRVIERADTLDWQRVIDRARAFRWDAAVAEALHRTAALFGTPVPANVMNDLSRGAATSTEAHVRGKSGVEASRAETVWREFLCLDAAGRRQLLAAILFPSPAYVKWRYPDAGVFWPLAYPYRWSVVAREGAGFALRVLTSALTFVCL